MAGAPDSSRQIRRGRAHKDRAFVLFANHGGRQESSDIFALIRISTFFRYEGSSSISTLNDWKRASPNSSFRVQQWLQSLPHRLGDDLLPGGSRRCRCLSIRRKVRAVVSPLSPAFSTS